VQKNLPLSVSVLLYPLPLEQVFAVPKNLLTAPFLAFSLFSSPSAQIQGPRLDVKVWFFPRQSFLSFLLLKIPIFPPFHPLFCSFFPRECLPFLGGSLFHIAASIPFSYCGGPLRGIVADLESSLPPFVTLPFLRSPGNRRG